MLLIFNFTNQTENLKKGKRKKITMYIPVVYIERVRFSGQTARTDIRHNFRQLSRRTQ